MFKAFIGYDTRMPRAWHVAATSLRENTGEGVDIKAILLPELVGSGLYNRPTEKRDNGLYDVISGAPMATEFAISRFFVPLLSEFKGWSLFCDSDFMFLSDIERLFSDIKDEYAVMCVKHDYQPTEAVKMDGQAQTSYSRKNWSSLILFNNEHPANRFLMPDNLNALAGRDLHRFCWLKDEEIGGLDESWNWLEGHSSNEIVPDAIHYTRGTPDMVGYEDVPMASKWWEYARKTCLPES